MNVVTRIVMTLISGVAALYFVFWVGSSLTLSFHFSFWIDIEWVERRTTVPANMRCSG